MARRLQDLLERLAPAERDAVAARLRRLSEEAEAIAALRRVLATRAAELSRTLGAGPGGLAKMERRVDSYVEAVREALQSLGGDLQIVARLPDGAPVTLTQFQGLSDSQE